MIEFATEHFYTQKIYVHELCADGEHVVFFLNTDSDEKFIMNHEEIKEALTEYKAKSPFLCGTSEN